MGLTPADITNTSFTHSRKGYDVDEVDSYLRALAARVAAEPSEDFDQIGDEVASVLRAANETASTVRSRAEAEAAAAVAEAERAVAEVEQRRAAAEVEVTRSLAEAEAYAGETRQAADTYSDVTRREADEYAAQTRQEADEYAAQTRQAADAYADVTRTQVDEYAEHTRDTTLEEARTIRAQAEDDAQRRSAALVAAAEEKVHELEGVETEIRTRVQSVAIDVQRLAGLGNGVIDLRERRRADGTDEAVGDDVVGDDEQDSVPASRAVWTAVGDAMAGTESPAQESSAS